MEEGAGWFVKSDAWVIECEFNLAKDNRKHALSNAFSESLPETDPLTPEEGSIAHWMTLLSRGSQEIIG